MRCDTKKIRKTNYKKVVDAFICEKIFNNTLLIKIGKLTIFVEL